MSKNTKKKKNERTEINSVLWYRVLASMVTTDIATIENVYTSSKWGRTVRFGAANNFLIHESSPWTRVVADIVADFLYF